MNWAAPENGKTCGWCQRVPPTLRGALARFTRASVPGLRVLAWNEIPDNRRVRLVAAVGR